MKSTRWILPSLLVAAVAGSIVCLADDAKPAEKKVERKKVLLYSQSFGFRHSVVCRPLTGELSHAEKIFKKIATEAGYEVFLSQDFNDLNGDQFKNYDAVVFYTSGNPAINRDNLMKYVKNGGALIGIHSATDTYKDWEEYRNMIGGEFKTHGHQKEAVLKVEVPDHPATRMIPRPWKLMDEYYLFTDRSFSRDNVRVLVSIDTEKTPAADLEAMKIKPGEDIPVAWTNTVGKGRVFYTSLGHREDVWTNEIFQKHLLGGLAWALDKDKKD